MTLIAEPTRAPLSGEPLPIELMNTIWADRRGVHDALSTEADALAWLRAVGPRLAGDAPAVSEWLDANRPADLTETAAELRRLRDALRRLTAETTDDPRPTAASSITHHDTAVQVLNQVAATSPPWPALTWPVDGEPAHSLRFAGPAGPAVVSLLATEFIAMVASSTRPQLRACLAPGCVLYFAKDHHRREWCSATCGNRARAARHYQRRKATSG